MINIKHHKTMLDDLFNAHKEHIWSKAWLDSIHSDICKDCNPPIGSGSNSTNQGLSMVQVQNLKQSEKPYQK